MKRKSETSSAMLPIWCKRSWGWFSRPSEKTKMFCLLHPIAGKIAVVGPLNKAKKDMMGNWSAIGKAEEVISVLMV